MEATPVIRSKTRAYLDIETTGLSRAFSEITVVGIAVEQDGQIRVARQVETITDDWILETLHGVDELYTYNGSRFDLPMIKAKLKLDLKQSIRHTDLMYACWKNDLKGGLKAVEKKIGITRDLPDMDGFMAVVLWWRYKNDADGDALETLLRYNEEDVVNLDMLRRKLGVD
ncbi:MAG: ribonuclease H-like domain-containing protein [Phycisphaerae bacterium]|nr:ribonuclease H-like domain-containing protein [Phycisphaerae bacterium]